jgi:hypothetical protein
VPPNDEQASMQLVGSAAPARSAHEKAARAVTHAPPRLASYPGQSALAVVHWAGATVASQSASEAPKVAVKVASRLAAGMHWKASLQKTRFSATQKVVGVWGCMSTALLPPAPPAAAPPAPLKRPASEPPLPPPQARP